jgi:hypothetical protein
MKGLIPAVMLPGVCSACQRPTDVWITTGICARIECHGEHINMLALQRERDSVREEAAG